ncbi:ATP-binding protein [Vreelandella aquamarina]|nr:RNA-binding domain-containing protein [Halomonas meridiana]
MHPKSIVGNFVEALAAPQFAKSAIAIKLSSDPTLDLPDAETIVEGFDWIDRVDPNKSYDLVVVDIPLGMGRKKIEIGGSTISARENWIELSKALHLLTPIGLCVSIVEPPAFGISEGPKFQEALASEGFYLNGVFNVPPNLLTTTTIRPVIVAFSREDHSSLFVAELEEKNQAVAIAQAFSHGDDPESNSLHEGMTLVDGRFDGFESLKARLQVDRLKTQYKDYKSYVLGEIAIEMNTVRSGESLEHKDNSIYVPTIGTSVVTDDLSSVTIKHHNLIQVVLSDIAKSQYAAAFFRSDLGLLILRSLVRGAVIPLIKKSDLAQAQIAVPTLKEQQEIVRSHSQLQTLKVAIANFQRELALNPGSASAIRGQVDSMLETIGGLTEADRVMSLSREGESATVEFKESFSLDVRKGTKEKYIELSALKTIVAFLNTNGGVLLVGVTDAGDIPGIRYEVEKFHKSVDAFLLHFKNQLKQRVGEQNYPYINHRLVDLGHANVLMVDCKPASSPCYLDGKEFYVRTNPATDKLEGPKLVEYVQNHFNK